MNLLLFHLGLELESAGGRIMLKLLLKYFMLNSGIVCTKMLHVD